VSSRADVCQVRKRSGCVSIQIAAAKPTTAVLSASDGDARVVAQHSMIHRLLQNDNNAAA
jgi:hypothetical protein